MKIYFMRLSFVFCAIPFIAYSQTTNAVILDAQEMENLKSLIKKNKEARQLYDSVARQAKNHLDDSPRPLEVIYYEGLLETNPNRVDTRKSLEDIDKVVDFIYASYGSKKKTYAQKAKEYVTAWAATYQPTGNTINENKFVPLFWAYYLFQDEFAEKEQQKVEGWMLQIARAQMARPHTPNNNWQAKRQKIIGTVGCITDNDTMKNFAIAGLKKYINTAYFADGTSNDLKQRDAMHYHVSGLKPTLGIFINLSKFDPGFDLFDYTSPEGASIKKSVEYTLPYVTGELTHKEWVNTKVQLDKERAAAGLAEYQPGKLFDPKEAIPTFEWACYYNPDWYTLFGPGTAKGNYTASWIGLLNSPLVRE